MYRDTKEIQLLAPSYYEKFKCTADKCRHSCCIDWEICIDGKAYEKYKQNADIYKTIEVCGGAHFILGKNGRCPHLNDFGLCELIISHGEEYLSDICKNHPRFFNRVSKGRIEAGLGIVCEEACRLILEEDSAFSLLEIDSDVPDIPYEGEGDYNPLPDRDRILKMISANSRFDEKLGAVRNSFGIPELKTHAEWIDRLLELEILDQGWESDLKAILPKVLCGDKKTHPECEKYYERLLTYFIYRHVSVADSADDLTARLAFALLSAELIKELFEAGACEADKKDARAFEGSRRAPDALVDWARRYSAEIEYSEENTAELIFDFIIGSER